MTGPAPFCEILYRRAWDMTDADVIRLGANQGAYSFEDPEPGAPDRRCAVRHIWREVLGVYLDRDSLEATHADSARGLRPELAKIADAAFEGSDTSVVIRVLLHELSDPGESTDLFVTLNRVDLVEVQSLPAPGRTWPDPAPPAVP
jgi:hypothetical protein